MTEASMDKALVYVLPLSAVAVLVVIILIVIYVDKCVKQSLKVNSK